MHEPMRVLQKVRGKWNQKVSLFWCQKTLKPVHFHIPYHFQVLPSNMKTHFSLYLWNGLVAPVTGCVLSLPRVE